MDNKRRKFTITEKMAECSYIFQECIANVTWKILDKDDTRSANDENFKHNKQIDLLSVLRLSLKKHRFAFFKDFPCLNFVKNLVIMFCKENSVSREEFNS